jgi:hypothetical protein
MVTAQPSAAKVLFNSRYKCRRKYKSKWGWVSIKNAVAKSINSTSTAALQSAGSEMMEHHNNKSQYILWDTGLRPTDVYSTHIIGIKNGSNGTKNLSSMETPSIG